MSQKQISKYLARYAEPIIEDLVSFPRHSTFADVVVIPAYKESTDFIERFIRTDFSSDNLLLIIVINQPVDDLDKLPQQALFNAIVQLGHTQWRTQALTFIALQQSASNILVVDGFSTGLPSEQGVGLARKLGSDIAVALIQKGIIANDWIHSTDADAHLPVDYFSVSPSFDQESVAGCYNFSHYSKQENIH